METFKPFLGYFFPGECYHRVFVELNFLDVPCLKLLNSRILSSIVLLGALIVKVPQIVKIVSASSVENLSYLANILELAAVTFTSTYSYAKGFPFSTWGESFFIAIQLLILLGLMFHYNHHMMYMAPFAPIYGVVVWCLISGLASIELLAGLQASVIFLMLGSRLFQVVTTFMNKTTGQLSFITAFLNWGGTAARIFTTVQETEDPILLLMYLSSFTMNFIILVQFAIYWNVPVSEKDKRKKTS